MIRIIARLDVKPPYVVKPICFEGLRKIGRPGDLAAKYYADGADELLYLDIVASLYQREILPEQIAECSQDIFIPFAAGGGIRTVEDCSLLFHHGVDKIVVNTHALQQEPSLIDRAVAIFGAQAVVVHVEAKRWDGWWECYTDCGRNRTGRNALDWMAEVQERGAGEIVVSSVDHDGRQRGFDLALLEQARSRTKIPLVAASGAGHVAHILEVVRDTGVNAVAIGSVLHYQKTTINTVKRYLAEHGEEVTL